MTTALFVGNIDARVTRGELGKLFSSIGPITSLELLKDPPPSSNNHAVITFANPEHVSLAIHNYGNAQFYGCSLQLFATPVLPQQPSSGIPPTPEDTPRGPSPMATPGSNSMILTGFGGASTPIMTYSSFPSQDSTPGSTSEDTSVTNTHLFVGDLSPEVTDQLLFTAFATYPGLTEARVMWDPVTGRSRGFGFVAFVNRESATAALEGMNGEWIGKRNVRVNWANAKTTSKKHDIKLVTTTPEYESYEDVLKRGERFKRTVYVGNLAENTTQMDLIPHFQKYGFLYEIRMQPEKGFAFFKMDTHEHAASAIYHLNKTEINGQSIRCAWGKERGMEHHSPYPTQAPLPRQPMNYYSDSSPTPHHAPPLIGSSHRTPQDVIRTDSPYMGMYGYPYYPYPSVGTAPPTIPPQFSPSMAHLPSLPSLTILAQPHVTHAQGQFHQNSPDSRRPPNEGSEQ